MRPIAHPPTPGWKAETRETFRIAGPLALANLLQMLTYAIDVIFIARLGADELAASSLAIAVFGLIVWSLQALTGAVAPIMSAELGARGPALRPVRRAMRMALWLALIVSAFGMALCALGGPLMRVTGQEAHITALAVSYMGVLMWSVAPMVMAGVLRCYVSALGRPVFATLITATGIGVNALGNYAFIFGNLGAPEMGLPGAAVATFLTSLAIVAMYAAFIRFDARLHRYHIMGFFWRPDWARFKDIVRIGTPISITIIAEAGVFGAAAFLMGRIGGLELAAHTLALNLAAFAFQVPFGVGQAATIRVGYFLWSARSGRNGPRRMDQHCDGHSFHGAHLRCDGVRAGGAAVRLYRSLRSGQCRACDACRRFPADRRCVSACGRGSGRGGRRTARPSGYAHPDVDRDLFLLGAGLRSGRRSWPVYTAGREPASGWGWRPDWPLPPCCCCTAGITARSWA